MEPSAGEYRSQKPAQSMWPTVTLTTMTIQVGILSNIPVNYHALRGLSSTTKLNSSPLHPPYGFFVRHCQCSVQQITRTAHGPNIRTQTSWVFTVTVLLSSPRASISHGPRKVSSTSFARQGTMYRAQICTHTLVTHFFLGA